MARKAEVIYVGDASSIVRASKEAEAATANAARNISGAHSKIGSSFVASAKSMAKFTAATAAIVGVSEAVKGVASSTIEFDKSMRNVNSIAQLNEKQFGSLEKQVLSLAGKTAQAPKTLA